MLRVNFKTKKKTRWDKFLESLKYAAIIYGGATLIIPVIGTIIWLFMVIVGAEPHLGYWGLLEFLWVKWYITGHVPDDTLHFLQGAPVWRLHIGLYFWVFLGIVFLKETDAGI